MKRVWFKAIGPFSRSVHPTGFLITWLAFIFLMSICSAVKRNGPSVSEAFESPFCIHHLHSLFMELEGGKNVNTLTK